MYDVAALVGDALREVQRRDGPYLMQSNIDASASFLVGGQIKGEEQRLFHIYPQGNFIEATRRHALLPARRERSTASPSSTAWSPPPRRRWTPPSAC